MKVAGAPALLSAGVAVALPALKQVPAEDRLFHMSKVFAWILSAVQLFPKPCEKCALGGRDVP